MNLNRLQSLSGQNPNQSAINQLIRDQAELNKAYTEALDALNRGETLNEGLFTKLKVAWGTANNIIDTLGVSAGKIVADKVEKLSTATKELYQKANVKSQLETLVRSLQSILDDFKQIESKAPTIIGQDPEVSKELKLFSDIAKNMIMTLQARMAVLSGLKESFEIQQMISKSHLKESMNASTITPQDVFSAIRGIGTMEDFTPKAEAAFNKHFDNPSKLLLMSEHERNEFIRNSDQDTKFGLKVVCKVLGIRIY